MEKQIIQKLFDIKGKVALVTGATGNLGKAVCEGFGLAGVKVMMTGRSKDKLEKLQQKFTDKGIDCKYSTGNPVDEADVIRIVDETVQAFGGIDILVTTAGINNPKSILQQPKEEWEQIMDVNVLGTWLFCKYTGKVLVNQKKGGKVILVSSTRGKLGMRNYTAYCPSKAAIDLLTKSLACEWGEHGINVNAIGPTVFRSELTQWMFDDDTARTKFLTRIPIGRLGEPEDFVGVCIFLASAASDFMTGTTVYVDGGYLAG